MKFSPEREAAWPCARRSERRYRRYRRFGPQGTCWPSQRLVLLRAGWSIPPLISQPRSLRALRAPPFSLRASAPPHPTPPHPRLSFHRSAQHNVKRASDFGSATPTLLGYTAGSPHK
jgi:hypothetical protein